MDKPGEMNFASESTNCLAWLQKVEEECENEASEEHHHEIKVLEEEARKTVWLVCSMLGVIKHGVPGHACQLFERYIQFHEMEICCNFNIGSQEFQISSHSSEDQLLLIVVACVKLSAKMFMSHPNLSTKVVCMCLRLNGFAEEEMNAVEFYILKTLNFTLPLWTSVDVAQLLAYAIGISEPLMDEVEVIMNLAEFRRNKINQEARATAGLSLSPSGTYVNKTVRSLHLAAGAVLALMEYRNLHDLEREKKLATFVCTPYQYLKCLSLIIYKLLIESVPAESQSNKKNTMSEMTSMCLFF